MPVIVAGTSTPEGKAAHRFALQEAARRNEDLVYFVLDGNRPDSVLAAEAGVTETYAEPDARGRDAVGDLLDHAERLGASAIVVGVRHRSPVGKLLLGSAAQQIILEANTPVISVKP
jgi:nucleotide-binding universal stress UspA family protein